VIDQVTLVFNAPVTEAVNWAALPAPREIVAGASVIVTGTSMTEAVADFVGSATLVAVTVMACWAVSPDGAV